MQLPYGMRSIRGICNLRQVYWLHYIRKTIAGLLEIKTCLFCLTSHEFVTVENDHGAERRIAAHSYRDMTPFRVNNMKENVIDKTIVFVQMQAVVPGWLHIPYQPCFWQVKKSLNGRQKCHHLRINIGFTAVKNITKGILCLSVYASTHRVKRLEKRIK